MNGMSGKWELDMIGLVRCQKQPSRRRKSFKVTAREVWECCMQKGADQEDMKSCGDAEEFRH